MNIQTFKYLLMVSANVTYLIYNDNTNKFILIFILSNIRAVDFLFAISIVKSIYLCVVTKQIAQNGLFTTSKSTLT